MLKYFNYLLDLFYPNLCLICGGSLVKNEKQLCLKCINNIPKTNYHLQKDNPVEKRFWGKVPVVRATSSYFFQKGSSIQQITHELKYKGNREIGIILGRLAAVDLLDSADFSSIDVIIPVPIHKKKIQKRTYNQSQLIAEGLSEVMKKPVVCDNLYRIQENESQTRKSVFERYENTQGIFGVKHPETLKGLHILIVDDVLTTGSTLEACIHALLKAEGTRVSVYTLALAQ